MTRYQELNRMTKHQLAQLHATNGGIMGVATYLKWRKDELVAAVLEDEKRRPDLRGPSA